MKYVVKVGDNIGSDEVSLDEAVGIQQAYLDQGYLYVTIKEVES